MQVKQWSAQTESTLHGDEVVGAGGPGDLADGEREAVRRSHGTGDDDHLVRLGSSMHTPYLARHCRQNMVGSLPRGIPKVVDCQQTDAQATNKTVITSGSMAMPNSLTFIVGQIT